MTSEKPHLAGLLLLAVATLAAGSACSLASPISRTPRLIETVHGGGGVRVAYARALFDGTEISIEGRVRRTGRIGFNHIPGHMHASVRSLDGDIIATAEFPLRMLPRPRQTAREASFSVLILVEPVPTSLPVSVGLEYHAESTVNSVGT